MNCHKQFSLLLVIAFASFELNCGGGPQNPSAFSSSSNTQVSSAPTAAPLTSGDATSSTATTSTGNPGSGAGTSGASTNSGTSSSSSPTTGGSSASSSGTTTDPTSGTTSSTSGNSGGTSASANPPSDAPNNGNPQGTTLSNLHQQAGWTGYGLLAPSYSICGSCSSNGSKVTWSMQQGINDPSQSGNSSQFTIGGNLQYSDALWNNHLIGDFSSQGKPDADHKIVPSVHNFTYDVYFFLKDLGKSQAVEFDINQFVNGKSFIWGHECRIAGGNEWDIWDNPGQKWHPTGVGCWPKNNAWNHLVIQAQRTSDDKVLFQSITLNGQTATLNYKEDPTPTSWYGITINYQQDGNFAQQSYSVWLDKLNFTYR